MHLSGRTKKNHSSKIEIYLHQKTTPQLLEHIALRNMKVGEKTNFGDLPLFVWCTLTLALKCYSTHFLNKKKKSRYCFCRCQGLTGVEETFSYLNISKINSTEVQNNGECAFACLKEPMCFSYNFEASASKTGTRVCELLPSDKYNNSGEVIISQKFNHYSIQVSDLMFNIEKNCTCSRRNAPG